MPQIYPWCSLVSQHANLVVTYPDWMTAPHFPGRIMSCYSTRNKERVYDVEYDDGAVLTCVREEFIRGCQESQRSGQAQESKKKTSAMRISEGIRVLAKVTSYPGSTSTPELSQLNQDFPPQVTGRRGDVKFFPGRVTRVHKGGLFDVEVHPKNTPNLPHTWGSGLTHTSSGLAQTT